MASFLRRTYGRGDRRFNGPPKIAVNGLHKKAHALSQPCSDPTAETDVRHPARRPRGVLGHLRRGEPGLHERGDEGGAIRDSDLPLRLRGLDRGLGSQLFLNGLSVGVQQVVPGRHQAVPQALPANVPASEDDGEPAGGSLSLRSSESSTRLFAVFFACLERSSHRIPFTPAQTTKAFFLPVIRGLTVEPRLASGSAVSGKALRLMESFPYRAP